jgi:hypothetical protein
VSSYTEYRHSFFRWWDILLAAVAVLFALVGVDVLTSIHWTPRTVALPDGEAVYYPWRVVWLVAGAGVVLVAVGFILGMERQFHNWLVVAVGVGLLTLGTSYVAMERVAITDDGFSTRRWWGLRAHTWHFDDLQAVTVVTHQGRKGAYRMAVRCQSKGEGDPTHAVEVGVPRLLYACHPTLRQRGAAKGVPVTAITATR